MTIYRVRRLDVKNLAVEVATINQETGKPQDDYRIIAYCGDIPQLCITLQKLLGADKSIDDAELLTQLQQLQELYQKDFELLLGRLNAVEKAINQGYIEYKPIQRKRYKQLKTKPYYSQRVRGHFSSKEQTDRVRDNLTPEEIAAALEKAVGEKLTTA